MVPNLDIVCLTVGSKVNQSSLRALMDMGDGWDPSGSGDDGDAEPIDVDAESSDDDVIAL